MLNLVFLLMLGSFLIGTPVLLYASWFDEWFVIMKRVQPKQPQFADWLIRGTEAAKDSKDRRVRLVLVRG